MKYSKKDFKMNEAKKELLNYIKPDDTILIIIKSVSTSGMCRRMKVLTNTFADLTYLIGDLCDLSVNEKGLKINGCGMDMAFWLADRITKDLYPKQTDGLNGNGSIPCLKYKTI